MSSLIDRVLAYAALVLAVLLLMAVQIRSRNRRLARQRVGEGLEGFREHFATRGVPVDVAESVYRKVQEWAGESAFPVRPLDQLSIYGLGFEHFDEFLGELVTSAGRRASERIIAEAIPGLKTVEDVVLFVAACPTAA